MPVAASNPSPKSSAYWHQTMQNRMLMVVLAMVVLVPLLASPSNPAMQTFSTYALRLMAALLAGILVMRAQVATSRNTVLTFFGTGANLAVLLFFIESLASIWIAPPIARRLSMMEFMRILTGTLLYFAVAYHIRRSEHLVKILDALVLVAGVMAILGLITVGMQGTEMRANLFGDHQLFAAFLMILFPLTVISALTERDTKRQVTAQVVAALTGICLLMTGTRTAWLGAVVELAALSVFSVIIAPNKNRLRHRRWQYLLPFLVVLACIGLFSYMGGFGGLLSIRLQAESRASSLAYRQRMWYAAEELIKQKPIFGHGLGTYAVFQHQYSRDGRPGQFVLANFPSLSENAHNFWLQTAAEQGLVGACLFAAILLTFLVSGLRRLYYLEGGIRRSLLLACLASTLGFAVDAIGNPAWQYPQVAMFLWLILGIGVACLRPRSSRHDG